MQFISRLPPPEVWLADWIWAARKRPPTAAIVEQIMKTEIRIHDTLIPARRAPSMLPPSAKICRPYVVRRSTKSSTTMKIRKISRASGRPLYWLSVYATTKPTTASRTVRTAMSAGGRNGTPAARRRRASIRLDARKSRMLTTTTA